MSSNPEKGKGQAVSGGRSGAAGVVRVGSSGAVKRAHREPRAERESASARRGARATVGAAVPRDGVSSPKGSRDGRENGQRIACVERADETPSVMALTASMHAIRSLNEAALW